MPFGEKEVPIFEVGDVVVIQINRNCVFNWTPYMDRFVGEEHIIESVAWDQLRSCYCYRVDGLQVFFDAECFIPKEDIDNYKTFESDDAAFGALYDAFTIV